MRYMWSWYVDTLLPSDEENGPNGTFRDIDAATFPTNCPLSTAAKGIVNGGIKIQRMNEWMKYHINTCKWMNEWINEWINE